MVIIWWVVGNNSWRNMRGSVVGVCIEGGLLELLGVVVVLVDVVLMVMLEEVVFDMVEFCEVVLLMIMLMICSVRRLLRSVVS